MEIIEVINDKECENRVILGFSPSEISMIFWSLENYLSTIDTGCECKYCDNVREYIQSVTDRLHPIVQSQYPMDHHTDD